MKRSKVKLLKRLTPINSADQQATRSQRLSTEIETSAIEYLQAEDTPSIGAEETVFATISPPRHTRQDTIDKLNSMTSLIINSIKTNIPLSDLHRELHIRRHMKFKDLFNWRTDSYPSYYTEYPQEDQLETTYEMSNLLAQWYLDSFEIKIPEYQYTGEDFDFSTRWSEESMDNSTKVLLPVVEQLLATSKASANSDNTLATPASLRLEDSCVTWGGQFEGNELVNTCPVDNFITLLNLHSHKVSSALRLANVSPSQRLQTMLSHITSREFDELRNWLAP